MKRVLLKWFFVYFYIFYFIEFCLLMVHFEIVEHFLLKVFVKDGGLEMEYDFALILNFYFLYLCVMALKLLFVLINFLIERMIDDFSMIQSEASHGLFRLWESDYYLWEVVFIYVQISLCFYLRKVVLL